MAPSPSTRSSPATSVPIHCERWVVLMPLQSNIMQRNPREPLTVRLERHLTRDMRPGGTQFRSWLEASNVTRNLVKVMAVLGVSFVLADGVLTPAQSVLGAIQGYSPSPPRSGRG